MSVCFQVRDWSSAILVESEVPVTSIEILYFHFYVFVSTLAETQDECQIANRVGNKNGKLLYYSSSDESKLHMDWIRHLLYY